MDLELMQQSDDYGKLMAIVGPHWTMEQQARGAFHAGALWEQCRQSAVKQPESDTRDADPAEVLHRLRVIDIQLHEDGVDEYSKGRIMLLDLAHDLMRQDLERSKT